MQINKYGYGVGASSYQAAGELAGLQSLVAAFYRNMDRLPEAKKIRAMHSDDLSESRQKLAYFLSGWLGGPRIYAEHYGGISIPGVHRHLDIGPAERDAWLLCMARAIDEQNYDETFKHYLLEQLKIPAERVTEACR